MKIGKFSSENNISIETIRHYMDLGLIIPEKNGGNYDFDERCQKDLEDILHLKKLGFTLHEIKSLLTFKRLGRLTPYQEEAYYIEMFTNKYDYISKQLEELQEMKEKLKDNLRQLNAKSNDRNFIMGVAMKILPLLSCSTCHQELTLAEGQITDNQIMNGKLQCKCGEEYQIEDGILYGKHQLLEDEILFKGNYVQEYINETNPEYLDNIYKGLEWSYKRLNFEALNKKVILDLGSGVGFLLRHIYHEISDDSLYIAVDYDIRRQRFLKNMLEKADVQKNILFICTDFLHIPIKNKSVDMLVDYTGTSNYSFNHEEFLLALIDHHVKEEAVLLGAYIIFKKFHSNGFIEEKYRENYRLPYIKEEISKLQYKLIDEISSSTLPYAGRYENYFTEDEKVYSYLYYGKK